MGKASVESREGAGANQVEMDRNHVSFVVTSSSTGVCAHL